MISSHSYDEHVYHETFAFIYGHGSKSNKPYNIMNITDLLSLSILNNELFIKFCDQTKQRYYIKPDTQYEFNIDFDGINFQLMVNGHVIYQIICSQSHLKLNEIMKSDMNKNTEWLKIWRIDNVINSKRNRYLVKLFLNDLHYNHD